MNLLMSLVFIHGPAEERRDAEIMALPRSRKGINFKEKMIVIFCLIIVNHSVVVCDTDSVII